MKKTVIAMTVASVLSACYYDPAYATNDNRTYNEGGAGVGVGVGVASVHNSGNSHNYNANAVSSYNSNKQGQGQLQGQVQRATSYGSSADSGSASSSDNSFTYSQNVEDRGFKDIPNWAYVPGAASAYAAPGSAIGQKTFGVQIPWLGFSGSTNDNLTRAMAVSAYAAQSGNTVLRRAADQVMQDEMDAINRENRSSVRSSTRGNSTNPFGY